MSSTARKTAKLFQRRAELPPAPDDLRILQAFLNTRVPKVPQADQLPGPQELADWLVSQDLLGIDVELNNKDHERAIRFRNGLRVLLAIGKTPKPKVVQQIERAIAPSLLRARLNQDGTVRLEPAATGIDGALGRLMSIVVAAQRDDRWSRLKVCSARICLSVFYDSSSNRSAKWCHPRCGNRISAQATRRHRREFDYWE